jgi:hypothetical protein
VLNQTDKNDFCSYYLSLLNGWAKKFSIQMANDDSISSKKAIVHSFSDDKDERVFPFRTIVGFFFSRGQMLALQRPGDAGDGILQDLTVYLVRSTFTDDVYGD